MAHDQTLLTMNGQRKQTVEAENAKTLQLLSEVLKEEIVKAYEQLMIEDAKLLDPLKDYNNHQVSLHLRLSLKEFYTRNPGTPYRIYWQPSHVRSAQGMELILRQYEMNAESTNVLGNILTGCTLPVLEEFRQHLRKRYPGASISSHFTGGSDPCIGIIITYTFDFQQGIPVMLHQKKSIGGGTVWNTEKIQQSN